VANVTFGDSLTRELLVGALHSTELPLWVVPLLVVGAWVLVWVLITTLLSLESVVEGSISRQTLWPVRRCSGVFHAFRGRSSHAFGLTPTAGEPGSGDQSSRSAL